MTNFLNPHLGKKKSHSVLAEEFKKLPYLCLGEQYFTCTHKFTRLITTTRKRPDQHLPLQNCNAREEQTFEKVVTHITQKGPLMKSPIVRGLGNPLTWREGIMLMS